MNTIHQNGKKRTEQQVPCQIGNIADISTSCNSIGVGVICRDTITTKDGRTFVRTDMMPFGYSMRDQAGNSQFCSFWNRNVQGSERK